MNARAASFTGRPVSRLVFADLPPQFRRRGLRGGNPGVDDGGNWWAERSDVETHVAVFTWVLERLAGAGLVQGKTVGVDATTLEANAAMRSIERRDTGESYEAFVRQLAKASGIETPTRAELARFDRSRKDRKTSNKEWQSPQDPDAKIAKMKDGRTHLAHKAEHGVYLETGAILSVTVQDAGLSRSLLNFASGGLPVSAPSRLFYATSATAPSGGASASKAPTR